MRTGIAIRIFKLACPLLILLATTVEAVDYKYLVYVGTYTGKGSDGVYMYRFDPVSGQSSDLVLAGSTDNPSFLTTDPDGRFLYAVNELDTFQNQPTGAISVFAIDRDSDKLDLLQQVSSLGAGPAHVSLDRLSRFLMVANYNSGNYAVFPIGNDGRLGPHSAFVQDAGSSVNPDRQAGPHAHSIQESIDNRFVLVADLGLDKVMVYRLDSQVGSLTPANPPFARVKPGSGPRHIAFHPSGKLVYLVNEIASTVDVFTYHPTKGTLRRRQTISTLPKDFKGIDTAAEIALDGKARFLYVSNRGHDSIVVFAVAGTTGKLTPVQWISSGGKGPRDFVIDPTGKWLIAANQESNIIALFGIDSKSGRLTPTDRSLQIVSPVCVHFVPLK
jgi:6-phosphogluconolactonase